jgi:hypothetical protein
MLLPRRFGVSRLAHLAASRLRDLIGPPSYLLHVEQSSDMLTFSFLEDLDISVFQRLASSASRTSQLKITL